MLTQRGLEHYRLCLKFKTIDTKTNTVKYKQHVDVWTFMISKCQLNISVWSYAKFAVINMILIRRRRLGCMERVEQLYSYLR